MKNFRSAKGLSLKPNLWVGRKNRKKRKQLVVEEQNLTLQQNRQEKVRSCLDYHAYHLQDNSPR